MNRFEKFSSLIFEITRQWHRISTEEMLKYDLKGSYALYLSKISNHPEGVTAARLSEECSRDKADVSRAVSAMINKGLIYRDAKAKNTYRAPLKLTELGLSVAKHVENRSTHAVDNASYGISDEDRATFYAVLEKITDNLKNINRSIQNENKIKMVLFDLDGTLAPMNMDDFMKAYFGSICARMAPFGYDPEELVKAIWSGTKAMVANDGTATNETVFWKVFLKHYPSFSEKHINEFDNYYIEDFDNVSAVCTPNPKAQKVVELIKEKGLRCALATNPFFPSVATEKRIAWAGFSTSDFEIFTTYENSCYAKPNLKYYEEVIGKLGVSPDECLMIGNDVDEDMCAKELGMRVFLVTDNLINKQNKDISQYPNGSFTDLIEFIKEI